MSIEHLKKKYSKRLIYIGGMCNSDVLVNGPKERIIDQVRNIIDIASDGGVVIGTHSIGIDIPLENYLGYHEAVLKYGNFS
jgi:hypothetical protein